MSNYKESMNSARTRAAKLAVHQGRSYDETDPHRDMDLLKDSPPPVAHWAYLERHDRCLEQRALEDGI